MKGKRLWRAALCGALACAMLVGLAMPVSADAGGEDVSGEGAANMTSQAVDNSAVSEQWASEAAEAKGGVFSTQSAPDGQESVRVSIVLERPSTIGSGFSTIGISENQAALAYRRGLEAEQETIQSVIEHDALEGQKLDVVWNLTLAANIISANVRRCDIEAIKAVPGVKDVVEETIYTLCDITVDSGEVTPSMALSGEVNGTEAAWDSGYYGQGTRIAIIDTGLDLDHQAFDEDAFMEAIEEDEAGDLLMTEDDLEDLDLNAEIDPMETMYYGTSFYYSAKVPFKYNYAAQTADNDSVSHDYDTFDGREHGSHVAGIAAANRYLPGGEKAEVVGNAPDAQLLIMKIAGDGGTIAESDYMAAIEDAIVLGADAINLSLGSTNPGRVNAGVYQGLMDELVEHDAVITVAAGNNYYWSLYGSPNTVSGNSGLYNDAGTFYTVGDPGSFANTFAVASLDAEGGSASVTVNGTDYRFNDSDFSDTVAGYRDDLADFKTLDKTGSGTTYQYVMLSRDIRGYEQEALAALAGEIKGKIAIVWRGTINLSVKAQAAWENGAAGEIIVNVRNDGEPVSFIPALNGYTGDMPVCSFFEKAGEDIWSAGADKAVSFTFTVDGEEITGSYITGELTVNGGAEGVRPGFEDYSMSVFSSWGVPGDLSLKPEITAPGGNILSVNGAVYDTDQYELMSGTSMASPQMAGLSALVQQYLRDEGISAKGLNSRALTQSLLMSTATPMRDVYGNFYPVFQQGAGRARVDMALSTPAYITVEGQGDGKVKAELGDDPAESGVYSVTFTIHNLKDTELKYALGADVFTQDSYASGGVGYISTDTRPMGAEVTFTANGQELRGDPAADTAKYDFNGDGAFDDEDSQLLLEHVITGAALTNNAANADVDGSGIVDTYDVHTLLTLTGSAPYAVVPANGEVTVTATIVLTGSERDRLAADYPAGAYIEAYITASPRPTEEGALVPELGIPVLGYYGNWTDPSMTDVGTSEEWFDTGSFYRLPYLYSALVGGGSNSLAADGYAVPGGHSTGPENPVNGFAYTLIRNAADKIVRISNADTGEVYWQSDSLGGEIGTFFSASFGGWYAPYNLLDFEWDFTDANGEPIPNGTRLTYSLITAPDYYAKAEYGYTEEGGFDWDGLTDGDISNGELGKGAYLESTVTLDSAAPEVESVWYQDIEESDGTTHTHIFAKISDSFSITGAALFSRDGEELMQELSPSIIGGDGQPVFEPTGVGAGTVLEFDGRHEYVTVGGSVWDKSRNKDLEPSVYLLQVVDEAGNLATYRIFVDTEAVEATERVEISAEDVDLFVGGSVALSAQVYPMEIKDRSFTWSSDDPSVATVDESGLVTAAGVGETVIRATAALPNEDGEIAQAVCHVKVRLFAATATGILGTAGSSFKFFDWSFPSGEINTDGDVTFDENYNYIISVQKKDDESFYLYDRSGYVYLYDMDGVKTEDVSDNWGSYPLQGTSFAYSDKIDAPLFLFSSSLLVGYKDESNPFYYYYWLSNNDCNFDLSQFGTGFYGMYVLDEDRSLDFEGHTYDYNTTVYLISADGNVVELYFNNGEILTNADDPTYTVMAQAPTDMVIEGAIDVRSNMVLGSDGALYVSLVTEGSDSSALYRLEYSESDDMWKSSYLGSTGKGQWPALLLELDVDGDTEPGPEPGTGETSGASSAGTGYVLDSIDWAGTSGTYGITVDSASRTVTVPVYATGSTNGEFTLSFGGALTLTRVTGSPSVLTSWAQADGEVHAGYAGKDILSQQVFTLVLSYAASAAGTDVDLTLSVVQDGANRTAAETSYKVSLPAAPAYVPSQPSVPSGPIEPVEDERPIEHVFYDVPQGAWYQEAVDRVFAAGLMNGMTEENFGPSLKLDRAMMAVILHRLAGSPETSGRADFADVNSRFYYAEAVAWASETGVMTGYGDGTFGPTKSITREQIAAVLWRFAKLNNVGTGVSADLAAFKDGGSVHGWAKDAMSWAVGAGLIKGRDNGTLDPTSNATRAEIAVILARYLDLLEK